MIGSSPSTPIKIYRATSSISFLQYCQNTFFLSQDEGASSDEEENEEDDDDDDDEDDDDINYFEGQKIAADLSEVEEDIKHLRKPLIVNLKTDIENLYKIKAKDTIEILHNIHLTNDKIQQIIHSILLKPRLISKDELNQTINHLYQIYSILRMVHAAWMAKKLSGSFGEELRILKDQIKSNMNKVIDVLEDNHQSLRCGS